MNEQITSEIQANFAAFEEKLPDLVSTHKGKFALMRHREIIEFFDTARDAFLTGQQLYGDGLFSVQEVVALPVDLGFFSHAVPSG